MEKAPALASDRSRSLALWVAYRVWSHHDRDFRAGVAGDFARLPLAGVTAAIDARGFSDGEITVEIISRFVDFDLDASESSQVERRPVEFIRLDAVDSPNLSVIEPLTEWDSLVTRLGFPDATYNELTNAALEYYLNNLYAVLQFRRAAYNVSVKAWEQICLLVLDPF